MTIRVAEQADFVALLTIMRTAPWDKTSYLDRATKRGDVVVAEVERQIVAYLVWNREFFSLPFIWLVTVLPEHRRKGIASALMSWAEARCAGQRVYSSTNRSNTPMQGLLARRGYRRCGEVDVDPGDSEVFFVKE